jgi:hypothetical protein
MRRVGTFGNAVSCRVCQAWVAFGLRGDCNPKTAPACGEFAAGCRVQRVCLGIAGNPTGNDIAEWVRQSLDPDTDRPRSQSIRNLTKTTATLVQPSSRNASVG